MCGKACDESSGWKNAKEQWVHRRCFDMEIAKTLSLEFAVLLNRFFVYDLTSREFSEYEKEFFTRLKKTINY